MHDKRILITGSYGFLGLHLVAHLEDVGYSHLIRPTHQEYDLTRRERIHALFEKEKPQIIIHCAAKVGGIGANRENPGLFFDHRSASLSGTKGKFVR